jgi:hypothetical protein
VPHEDVTRPVGESDGEEEDGAFDVCTTVPRHGEMSVSIYRFAWLHVRAFALHGLGRETLGYACSWHKAAEANTRAMSEVDISPLDGNRILALLTSSLRRSKWSGIESAADEK